MTSLALNNWALVKIFSRLHFELIKIFSRLHFELMFFFVFFFCFFFLQKTGNNLHEMSNPVSWEKNKKNITNLSSAELAQRMVKVKLEP